MGIQPQNAMTAQGYLNSIRALGATSPTPRAPGTAFDGGYDPQAARRKRFAEIWGSGQRGAPNYNKYMDRSNRDNYAPDGAWRGYVNGVDSLEHRAKFGLGGTGPDPRLLQDDARRAAQKKEWNATMAKYARPHSSMSPTARMLYGPGGPGGQVGDMLAAHIKTNTNVNRTPGIYVPGQKPAPFPDETSSDNSIPTPPIIKPNQTGGVGGMPSSTLPSSTPGNPLMNTMKPRQKPKFGTLGANRGMNGMGLGPNSVAKPGVYGTY